MVRTKEQKIKHKLYMRKYGQKWRDANREKYRKRQRENMQRYRSEHRYDERENKGQKIYNHRRRQYRQELIFTLGTKCIKCGFSDIRALTLDHINGGGCQDRKRFGKGCKGVGDTNSMYVYYRNNIEEAKLKLQVLCANCNFIKANELKEVGRKFIGSNT